MVATVASGPGGEHPASQFERMNRVLQDASFDEVLGMKMAITSFYWFVHALNHSTPAGAEKVLDGWVEWLSVRVPGLRHTPDGLALVEGLCAVIHLITNGGILPGVVEQAVIDYSRAGVSFAHPLVDSSVAPASTTEQWLEDFIDRAGDDGG